MGATSNASKQRWNEKNYVQKKFFLPPEIAMAFKARCEADGVSMASEIARFMSGRCQEAPIKKKLALGIETRQQRRKTLTILTQQLEDLTDAERQYKDSMPENLHGSCRYDAAEQAVSALENALENLYEVFF